MKKLYLFLIFVLATFAVIAQTPQKMTYQAVVRNSANTLIANQNVSARISIVQGNATGTVIYTETHQVTTNANGLMTVEIGGGAVVTGAFDHINWASGPYFLLTEIDPEGGINYSITTSQQLMSVPYALFAQEAANGFTGDYNDLTNIPNFSPVATSGDYNDLTNKPVIPNVPTNVSAFTNDAGYLTSFTENQILTISHDTIYLTGGSFVKLPTAVGFSGSYNDLTDKPNLFSGNYNDLTNKPTLFDGNYNNLTNKPTLAPVATSGNYNDLTNKPTLFDGNYNNLTNKPTFAPVATSGSWNDLTNKPVIPNVPTNVSAFTNDAGYLTSFTESQILTISHDTIYLTGGSFVKLPTAEGFSGSYNDLTDKPVIPTVPTNVSAFNNDAGYLTIFTESQILTISHDTIYLTGGSFVKLPTAEGFSGSYNDLTDKPNLFSGNYNDLTGKPNLFSGDYNDLTNKPTLFSGSWNDLTGKPVIPTVPTNVSAFNNDAGYLTSFTESQILTISHDTIYLTGGSFVKLPTAEGFSGSYNDLTDKPTLFSGNYNDLTGKPNLFSGDYNDLTNKPALFDGNYNNLTNKPTLAPVATSGSYNDLTDKPNLFSGNYNDLTGKPVIPTVPTNVSAFNNDAGYLTTFTESQILTISHDTIYLTGGSFVKLPTAEGFSGSYNDLTDKPTLFSGNYNDLTGKPNLFSGDYNDLTNKPALFDGNYNNLTNKPTLAPVATSGSYNDLTDKPNLFSGNYNDLTGKPVIPTVPTNVSAFNNDAGYLTSFTESQILTISHDTIYLTGGSFVKLPTAEGFSGSWNDLTDKPTLFSGNYNDLTGKPNLFSGDYNDLTNKPTLFDGNYNNLTNKPTLAPVATSGSYNDLTDKPNLFSGSWNNLTDKPNLFSGDYNDLTNKPTLFDGNYNNLTNKPTLAPVATSGSWNDLTDKPTLFSGSWNNLTDKPVIPTVPTNVSAFNNDAGYLTTDSLNNLQNALNNIMNNIPSVNNGTLTIQQNGSTVGTFTANQSSAQTVNITTLTTDNVQAMINSSLGAMQQQMQQMQQKIDSLQQVIEDGQQVSGGLPVVTITDVWQGDLVNYPTVYGSITSNGITNNRPNEFILAKGFVFSASNQNPTLQNSSFVTVDTNSSDFFSTLNIYTNTTYYVRAFATNINGTSYSTPVTVRRGDYYAIPPTGSKNLLVSSASDTIYIYTYGGPDRNYGKNFNGSLTLYPSSSSKAVRIVSATYNTESNYDYLTVYSGSSTSGSSLVHVSGSGSLSEIYPNNGDQDLTVKFTSDPSVFNSGVLLKVVLTDFCPSTVTDATANINYSTVRVKEQCWMKENLRAGNLTSGATIGILTDYATGSTTVPYRRYPNGDQSNTSTYSYLYNWPAVANNSSTVSDGMSGLCPSGWHIPTRQDVMTFANNTTASFRTSTSGFNAKMAGRATYTNTTSFYDFGSYAYFWMTYSNTISSFYISSSGAIQSNFTSGEGRAHYKSLRCLKD